EAFKNLVQKYPKLQAIFVGDGSCREELTAQIRNYRLQERIHFLGVRKDIPELLNAIDLFVLPSIAGEGLPNVVLEAMACGKPVVATRVGGTAEAVRDQENGYLAEPADVASLQLALEKALSDPQRLRRMGQRSREIAEQEFSLQKQISSFEKLYQQLYQEKVGAGTVRQAVALRNGI
ncbi:MAG: glycosyltransferase, partial [Calditrichaeota bacterium]